MICKDEADLHEEYARAIRMCKGTKVNPGGCVKLSGVQHFCKPDFTAAPNCYSFALAIVEDRPVFEGDVLYDKASIQCPADEDICWDYSALSWNPPKKKTFMLNGEELPLPDDGDGRSCYRIAIASVHFWNRWDDAEKVQSAIDKLLSGE